MDALHKKLNSWLDVLIHEIRELRIDQHIFWELQEIVSKNSKINTGNHFYVFVGGMYASAMSVAIRRLVDSNSRSISFLRLLQEIQSEPMVLSRARYRACYGNSPLPRDFQDDCFDRFVGRGRNCVDPVAVEREIAELKAKTSALKKYVNKRVAHHDRKQFKTFPTFQDVDDAVDYLEHLTKRYVQLFRAIDLTLMPQFMYDWKSIFRHPWIEE